VLRCERLDGLLKVEGLLKKVVPDDAAHGCEVPADGLEGAIDKGVEKGDDTGKGAETCVDTVAV